MTPIPSPARFESAMPYYSTVSERESPDLYEYLLVVNTGGDLSKQIINAKNEFAASYLPQQLSLKQPYIKVASYKARELMEPTLERWIQRICSNQQAFPVMLNNFSGFPRGKLFLRVQHHEPFKKLAASLQVIDEYVKSYGCPSAKLVTHPHVTIANKLPESIYTKAMLDYSHRDFNGSFMVHELVLLRRRHRNDECKTMNVFKLSPQLVVASEAV